jgi:hypothetical protein
MHRTRGKKRTERRNQRASYKGKKDLKRIMDHAYYSGANAG